jgi:TetR/AcrR family transcriptional regulator, lmrAB and yxaGH operons repressor
MDRASVVQTLVRVFRQHGYEGTTLSRISEATGLGRASLYYHFPNGKQEMAEAVLEYVGETFETVILAPLHREGKPSDRIRKMSDHLTEFYNYGREACLIALFSIGESNDLFHPQVNQALTAWIEGLTNVIIEAGIPNAEARRRAEDAVIQVQGAIVLTRGLDSTRPFERTLKRLPKQLLEPTKSNGTID